MIFWLGMVSKFSAISVGSESLFLTLCKGMRFPAIVLTCWTQLFCVACGILKFLLKLPYSGGTQRLFSVKYLFGEAKIAQNFL